MPSVVGLTGWLHTRRCWTPCRFATCNGKFSTPTSRRNLIKHFHALLHGGVNSPARTTCLDCAMRRRLAGVIFIRWPSTAGGAEGAAACDSGWEGVQCWELCSPPGSPAGCQQPLRPWRSTSGLHSVGVSAPHRAGVHGAPLSRSRFAQEEVCFSTTRVRRSASTGAEADGVKH